MMTCERCGATEQESPLTVSHVPQKALAKMVSRTWPEKKLRKYCLCISCHQVYSEMELQIIRKACTIMAKKHEEYINQ